MEQRERDETKDTLTPSGSGSGRALVIEPWIKRPTARTGGVRAPGETRTPEARLEEAMGLARAKAYATALRVEALAHLEPFGERALRLRQLADFIVLRKS